MSLTRAVARMTRRGLEDEHAVAVGEEAVALRRRRGRRRRGRASRLPAKALTSISSVDCGQVEVGEQAGDDAEAVAGAEKDAGRAGVGRRGGVPVGLRAQCSRVRVVVVPTAMMRRPSREGAVDGVGGGGGEGVVLGVEADVFEVLDADGLEGAEADVEGDGMRSATPRGARAVEDLRGEVEAGGGGGGGAGLRAA